MPSSPVKRIEVQPAGRTITAATRCGSRCARWTSPASRSQRGPGGEVAGGPGKAPCAIHHVAGRELGGQVPLGLSAVVPAPGRSWIRPRSSFCGVPGPSVRVEFASVCGHDRGRAVAPAERDSLLQGQRSDARTCVLVEQRVPGWFGGPRRNDHRARGRHRGGSPPGCAAWVRTVVVVCSVARSRASRSPPRTLPCGRAMSCPSAWRLVTPPASRSAGSRPPGASPPATGSSMPTDGSWPIARGRTR